MDSGTGLGERRRSLGIHRERTQPGQLVEDFERTVSCGQGKTTSVNRIREVLALMSAPAKELAPGRKASMASIHLVPLHVTPSLAEKLVLPRRGSVYEALEATLRELLEDPEAEGGRLRVFATVAHLLGRCVAAIPAWRNVARQQLEKSGVLRHLLDFVTLSSQFGQGAEVDVCAHLVSLLGVEPLLARRPDSDDHWLGMLDSTWVHLRGLAVRVFRESSGSAHSSGRTGSTGSEFHAELCRRLCSVLEVGFCPDAIRALYFTMDLMPKPRLALTFEAANVRRVVGGIDRLRLSHEDRVVVERVLGFHNGDGWENWTVIHESNLQGLASRRRSCPGGSPARTRNTCSKDKRREAAGGGGTYLSRLDIDPRIRYGVGTVKDVIRVKGRGGGGPGMVAKDACFPHHAQIFPKKMAEDVVCVADLRAKRLIEEHVVALLNGDDRDGILALGITSKCLVEGVVLTRKERDLFRQELDDLIRRVDPDPTPHERIDQPVFNRVTGHPLERYGSVDREPFVIQILVRRPKGGSAKKIWYKMRGSANGFMRFKGETVESTPNNVAAALLLRQNKQQQKQ